MVRFRFVVLIKFLGTKGQNKGKNDVKKGAKTKKKPYLTDRTRILVNLLPSLLSVNMTWSTIPVSELRRKVEASRLENLYSGISLVKAAPC